MREHKKPTRRKMPSRHEQQHQYSTVEDYEAPWWTTVYAILIILATVGVCYVLGAGRMMGWW